MFSLAQFEPARCLILALAGLTLGPALGSGQTVDFNRQIRPILSDNCFKCHGPDEHDRHANLRLDIKQGLENASDLISSGDAENSEFLRRITTDDHDEIMPPADSGRVLNEEQIELLTQWVQQGANWNDHWSFVKPKKPKHLPPVETEVCITCLININ